jgi:hypothetical protein
MSVPIAHNEPHIRPFGGSVLREGNNMVQIKAVYTGSEILPKIIYRGEILVIAKRTDKFSLKMLQVSTASGPRDC